MTDFAAIALKAAREAVAEAEAQIKQRAVNQLVLESDEALAVWVRKHLKSRTPVVRRSVYGSNAPSWPHDQWAYEFNSDPRRPVIMRGALQFMIGRYSDTGCGNKFALAVIYRFLRIKKYTCFDMTENKPMQVYVASWAARRFHLSYHFHQDFLFHWIGLSSRGDNENRCWINGELKRFMSRADFLAARAKHEAATKKPAPKPRKKLKRAELDREARIVSRALYELGIIQPGDTL